MQKLAPRPYRPQHRRSSNGGDWLSDEAIYGDVFVLIPARNEAGSIARTLESLRAQTYPLAGVFVVANNCDDESTARAAHIEGADVIEMDGNLHLKAGALNYGLDYLLQRVNPEDLILIMDADSLLVPGFVEAAAKELSVNHQAGAVCANFAGEFDRRGLIHALQRNEYARFARGIRRHKSKAQVLSGVATLFPASVLTEIKNARKEGILPAAPGIYEVTAATEDIEMTFAVRKLGYRPLALDECLAYTDTMDAWTALANQRIRWQRGMLDALRMYKLNKQTLPYVARLTAMYLGSLAPPFYLALIVATFVSAHHVGYSTMWLLVVPLFCFERAWTVRQLGWKHILLGMLLLPEWLYENYRAAVYWVALLRWLRRTERVWIPT